MATVNVDTENNRGQKVLVTGTAGFIGFHLAKKLLSLGFQVIGIDNLNDYYDVNLKLNRLKELGFSKQLLDRLTGKDKEPIILDGTGKLIFYREDLKEREVVEKIFETWHPDYVVNLAAQPGVRYSLENPYAYIDSNIVGFMNILENCRHNRHHIKHLVYASTSSIYGSNNTMPFSVHHTADHPLSLYAATKKSNELMAHAYSHLYQIPTTGLRLFTVYGPWGRPDMAYFLFTRKILDNIPIEVFNYGKMKRDFTYIDDVVEGIYKVMLKVPESNKEWDSRNPDPATSAAPYRVFNIGNHKPVDLLYFIRIIEKNLGKKAEKKLLPLQKGDVKETYADTGALQDYIGFQPLTPIEEGIANFIKWYSDYYEINR